MLVPTALVCVQCGGPLGTIKTIPSTVECSFCGAAIAIEREPILMKQGSLDEARLQKLWEGRRAFNELLGKLLAAGRPPFEAVREAAATHLGAGGENDTLARSIFAMARDFERDNPGAKVIADQTVLARLAEAYLKAIAELRSTPETTINLPFLAVTPEGPVHLNCTVTAGLLAELAKRDPAAPQMTPASPLAPTPPAAEAPTKKKRWWPFGG
jgi:hypothetical protein